MTINIVIWSTTHTKVTLLGKYVGHSESGILQHKHHTWNNQHPNPIFSISQPSFLAFFSSLLFKKLYLNHNDHFKFKNYSKL